MALHGFRIKHSEFRFLAQSVPVLPNMPNCIFPGLFRRHGSANYWFRYSINRQQARVSLATSNLSEAIVKAQAIRTTPELRVANHWEAEVERYLKLAADTQALSSNSVDVRKTVLLAEGRRMGWRYPLDITTTALQAWYDSLRKAKSDSTALSYLTYVRSYLNHCVETGKLRENPARDVNPGDAHHSARVYCAPMADVRRLIDGCQRDDLKCVLYLGFYLGLRRDEIVQARVEWLDLWARNPILRMSPRKPGACHEGDPGWKPKWYRADRPRNIRIPTEALEFRRSFVGDRVDGFIIHPEIPPMGCCIRRKNGKKYRQRYRWDFRVPFEALVSATNVKIRKPTPAVKRFTPHLMRHTYAGIRLGAGVPIYEVAKSLGDRVRTTEKHYGHLDSEGGKYVNAGFERAA